MSAKRAALVLGIALAGAVSAAASDPPHWSSANTTTDCTSQCHVVHAAAGGELTQSATNVTLCQSCHLSGKSAAGMPINDTDKANPAAGTGSSHSFDATAVNATYGAGTPTNTIMAKKVFGGKIVCSTCHDQHAANGAGTLAGTFGGTPHVSTASKITALGSTGSVASGGAYAGANGAWYLVEIYNTAGAVGTAKFHYSKDNGTSWFPATPGATLTSATAVALDNGITATFGAGNFVIGERWQFYAAWPFLRAPIDSGTNAAGASYCRDCHSAWVQSSSRVEGNDAAYLADGTHLFYHPVGEGLAHGYDRTGSTGSSSTWSQNILDGDGHLQSAGDGNANNDLKLDASGNLQCLSCHAMHYAPSNTTAVIP